MPRKCEVEGCERPSTCRRMCKTHYMAWYIKQGGKKLCAVDGCERRQYGKNELCHRHYLRVRQTGGVGTLAIGERPPPSEPETRFWRYVDKNGPVPEHRPDLGPCWIWTGAISRNRRYECRGGYGRLYVMRGGKRLHVYAHAFAYRLLVGPVPEGLELDHLCRTKHCCNPAHLEPVTHGENIRRGFAARRARQAIAA